jgi:hypothetical protein
MFSTRTGRVQTISHPTAPTNRHNGAMSTTFSRQLICGLRVVLNVANVSTPVGLLLAASGRCRLRGGGDGLILAEGYRLPLPRRGAFTVGNVVLVPGGTLDQVQERAPEVLTHEDAHAWQYAACLGLPFFALYAIASGWSWLRTGDPASANIFERSAGLARGGYQEQPRTNVGLHKITSAFGRGRPSRS